VSASTRRVDSGTPAPSDRARRPLAAATGLLNSTERIIGYKIRKYRIDPRRFRTTASRAPR
jgi:hypothetical protein